MAEGDEAGGVRAQYAATAPGPPTSPVSLRGSALAADPVRGRRSPFGGRAVKGAAGDQSVEPGSVARPGEGEPDPERDQHRPRRPLHPVRYRPEAVPDRPVRNEQSDQRVPAERERTAVRPYTRRTGSGVPGSTTCVNSTR